MARSKKAKATPTEVSLFNDMKRLAKKANQRILRLERLTGQTGTFATKQLYDYLDSEMLQAVTPKGRIAVRKSFSETQMKAIIKATNQFLEGVSSVADVKKETAYQSKQAGVQLSYTQANTYYQAQSNYQWIYKYLTPSEFWDIARECVKEGWSESTFIDNIMVYITDRSLDELLKIDLINLYEYIQGVKY